MATDTPRIQWTRQSRRAVAALTIALAGLLVYQWALGQPLWLDEQMLALNLRDRRLLDLGGALWLEQVAPVGWLLVERLLLLLVGADERVLRFLPLSFGLGTLALAYWTGRRWLTPIGTSVLVLLCGLGTWFAYHALELKPYSADAFFGLALPALAGWASEAEPSERPWRDLVWWAVASGAMWMSNGALFVAPACAAVLAVSAWFGDRRVAVPAFAGGAAIWLVSLIAIYQLSLAPAADSARLQSYWAFAFPPKDGSVVETARWLGEALLSVAVKPGSAGHPVIFWGAAALGLGFWVRRHRALGTILALVPVTMCALAVLHLVPMFERLSLWAVPAACVGIAMSVDAITRLAPIGRSSTAQIVLALAAATLGVLATIDVVTQSVPEARARMDAVGNHQLDDRAAVEWLIEESQPGDVFITSHLALPAVWWYGDAPVGPPSLGQHLAGNIPIMEARAARRGDCQTETADAVPLNYHRALVYFGFRFDDTPPYFDDLVLGQATAHGLLVAYRLFADRGVAAIVDFRQPPRTPLGREEVRPDGMTRSEVNALDACIDLKHAARW